VAALRSVKGWISLTIAYGAFGFGYILMRALFVVPRRDDAGFSAAEASAMFSAAGAGITSQVIDAATPWPRP